MTDSITLPEAVTKAREAIQSAKALIITAGAGMGVDSGLPDFRGTEGFWRAYPAIAKLGLSFAEMANPEWFEQDPQLAWAFYGHRLNLYRATQPHSGFQKLLNLGQSMAGGYFVFTSNVDGQFQKAGFDAAHLYECHGSIHHLQCTRLCSQETWSAENTEIKVDLKRFRACDPLPRCPHCTHLARPNILMFDDGNWISRRTDQQAQALQTWMANSEEQGIRWVVIELGAGTAIPTVRHFSEQAAIRAGTPLIRINPREPKVPVGHISIATGAATGIGMVCSDLTILTKNPINGLSKNLCN
jgi:NAD-dependent SIR2 family protein deacetylase